MYPQVIQNIALTLTITKRLPKSVYCIKSLHIKVAITPAIGIFVDIPVWELGQSLTVDTGALGTKRLPPLDEASLNASVRYAMGVISRMERIEANLANAKMQPLTNSPERNQFVHYYATEVALERGVDALVAIGASAQLTQSHCVKLVLLFS